MLKMDVVIRQQRAKTPKIPMLAAWTSAKTPKKTDVLQHGRHHPATTRKNTAKNDVLRHGCHHRATEILDTPPRPPTQEQKKQKSASQAAKTPKIAMFAPWTFSSGNGLF